jgi:hypothetical protein
METVIAANRLQVNGLPLPTDQASVDIMKRITYGNGSFVTGDAIAEAVLDYAAALANANRSEHLTVPGRDAVTGAQVVEMVIGPASQILASEEEIGPDVVDASFVDDLESRIQLLKG